MSHEPIPGLCTGVGCAGECSREIGLAAQGQSDLSRLRAESDSLRQRAVKAEEEVARLRAELEAIKKRAHIGWRTGDRIAEIYGIADAALSPPATPEPAPAKTFGGCGRCRAATGRVNDNYCADCKAILAAAEAKATEPEFSRVRMACARCSSDVWVNSGEPIRGTVLCAKCPPLSDPRDTSKAEAKP